MLIWLWLIWLVLECWNVVDIVKERGEILIGVIFIFFGVFNMVQVVRYSDPNRFWWFRMVGVVFFLVLGVGVFEGVVQLYLECRYVWMHFWNYQMGSCYYWVYDFMIRWLNLWFID